MVINFAQEIEGNAGVAIAAAGHGVDQAAPVFVANRVLALEGEVVGGTDVVGDGNHRWNGLRVAVSSLARGDRSLGGKEDNT